jgi:hypothetical protein
MVDERANFKVVSLSYPVTLFRALRMYCRCRQLEDQP